MNVAGKNLSQHEIDLLAGGGTHAVIDLDALAGNIRAFKAHVGENVRLAVAVKANAYGHGAVPVAREVLRAGASNLLVARMEEGIQLRLSGITAPILIMGYTGIREMPLAIEHNLTPTIIQKEQARAASEAAFARGVQAAVHIKADTGMNRNGACLSDVIPLAKSIDSLPSLWLEGLYTHFACADELDKSSALSQFDEFMALVLRVKKEGIDVPLLHAANSAAILDLPQTYLDMVRLGIAAYGLYGSKEVSRSVSLKPVLSLQGRVERIHNLLAGEGVSYGHDFVATKNTKVALVSIGYGDGYQRCLSGHSDVLVNGRRTKILGRVSMDQLVVNVSDVGNVCVGDPVMMIGRQGDEEISVAELAELAGTNENEFVTGLNVRIPRFYVRKEELVLLTGINPPMGLRLFDMCRHSQ